jgi:transcriptional regulator with XRE-family HTH domain
MTLTRYLLQLFAEKKVNAAEVARRTGLNPATFTHIKRGNRPTAENLVKILSALGYAQRDHQYLEAMSLWMASNASKLDTSKLALRLSSAESSRDKTAAKLLEQIAKLIEGLHAEDRANLLDAVRNPEAIRLWLESARALRAK